MGNNSGPTIELWGGAECTVNRVRDRFIDQLELTGHASRRDDLELFAGLGITALRYPVLWERVAPNGPSEANWSWPDERLSRLRELGIRPIVGLVHHGSGPRDTSLVDPAFPGKLAAYARAVAERYPWVDAYTPVNEPLTTARFSGLYGHWYPHGRDNVTFLRALLTECRGVVLAMRAIRHVQPTAQLVQTDDLGKVFSTPLLRYQADFENERRWLSFDLLCGRIDPDHPLWRRLLAEGAPRGELEWFLENRCPPDIVGVNHYLSSERYLDENLDRYPERAHGGNGRHRYADVPAGWVRLEGCAEPRELFREVAQRYGLPIAVTEAHNGSTREEQMRWFVDVWDAATELKAEGVDVRAVTAWSLLGVHGWNTLVTGTGGRYEPGVFDLRSPKPRATAMDPLLRDLAAGRRPHHPVLDTPGWWRRPDRLLYGHAVDDAGHVHEIPPASAAMEAERWPGASPILITGGAGTLGRAFVRACEERGLVYKSLTRSQLDIADADAVREAMDTWQPWAIVNAAGYVRVDDAEGDAGRCYRENVTGATTLAAACARSRAGFLTFSSDLVFDGLRGVPYVESDPVAPLNVYGRSKAEAEKRVGGVHPGALIVRTSAFFGPWDEYNIVTVALRDLSSGRRFVAASDAVVSPTYVPHLVQEALDLLVDGESGIWHLANRGAVSWERLVREAAALGGIDANGLEGRPTRELKLSAPRPLYTALGSERARLLPPLDEALRRYVEERAAHVQGISLAAQRV